MQMRNEDACAPHVENMCHIRGILHMQGLKDTNTANVHSRNHGVFATASNYGSYDPTQV